MMETITNSTVGTLVRALPLATGVRAHAQTKPRVNPDSIQKGNLLRVCTDLEATDLERTFTLFSLRRALRRLPIPKQCVAPTLRHTAFAAAAFFAAPKAETKIEIC